MAAKHYTALGTPINMSALAAQHADTVALGNARMNARGDILGSGGIVLKTQEQIDAEWTHRKKEMEQAYNPQPVNIKAPMAEMAPKPVLIEDRGFEPVAEIPAPVTDAVPETAPNRKRKIVDSE